MPKPVRVTIYRDGSRRFRWRAVAGNNRKVGASEQGYRSKFWCKFKARQVWPQAEIVDKT